MQRIYIVFIFLMALLRAELSYAQDRGSRINDNGPTANKPVLNIALVIGTDKYNSSAWPVLSNAVFDARSLKVILENKYDYDVTYLENPTKQTILDNIKALKEAIGKQCKHNTVNLLVFIAGHGGDEPIVHGYFVPSDATDQPASYIRYDNLRPLIDEIPAQHTLVLLDVCYGGSFVAADKRSTNRSKASAMYENMTDEELISRVNAHNSRIYIASANTEPAKDGQINSHAPFANFILDCLEANYLTGHIVSETELYESVKRMKTSMPVMANFGEHTPAGGEYLLIPKAKGTANSRATITIPKILILPKEIAGVNYEETFNDPDVKLALTKVRELLESKNMEVVDVSYPTTPTQTKTQLIKNSGANIYVEVDLVKKSQMEGNGVTLVLSAKSLPSGNSLYYKSNPSGYFRTTDYEILTNRALKDIAEEFVAAIKNN